MYHYFSSANGLKKKFEEIPTDSALSMPTFGKLMVATDPLKSIDADRKTKPDLEQTFFEFSRKLKTSNLS